jgi:hypothetical protein
VATTAPPRCCTVARPKRCKTFGSRGRGGDLVSKARLILLAAIACLLVSYLAALAVPLGFADGH